MKADYRLFSISFVLLIALTFTSYAQRTVPDAVIEGAVDTTGKVTQQANITQTFTAAVVEKYKNELTALEGTRQKVKAKIDKEQDPSKRRKEAEQFYRLQQEYLERLSADLDFTNKKIDELYSNIRTAMGGYASVEEGLDKESAALVAKKESVLLQNNLKGEAQLLLAEKKNFPGHPDNIDQTTDAWFNFADREDALLAKYEDVADDIRRAERRAEFYGQVKQALSAHKDRAAQWSGHARMVRRKYASLEKDVNFELEKVREMIALGRIDESLIAMAALGDVAGQVDGMVDALSKMGFLTDIEIGPIDGRSTMKSGVSLESIVGQ